MTKIEAKVFNVTVALKRAFGSELALHHIEDFCYSFAPYRITKSDTSVAFQSLCSKGAIKITNRMEIEVG